MIALLLATVAAQPVADVERAFAAMAQARGQWTAFRAFMAPDAIRLMPDPVPADLALNGLADPPHPIQWLPAETVTACDGSLAFSTGPWRLNGATGHFYTIWQRQPDGQWRWLLNGGTIDKASHPLASRLDERRAECGKAPPAAPAAAGPGGAAADGTLRWGLYPAAGGHALRVRYAAGGRWVTAADVVLQ